MAMQESPYKVQAKKLSISAPNNPYSNRSPSFASRCIKGLLIWVALAFAFEFVSLHNWAIAKLVTAAIPHLEDIDADAPSLLLGAIANDFTAHQSKKYFELKDFIDQRASNNTTKFGRFKRRTTSAYNEATEVHHAPWFEHRKKCRGLVGCCVETVAISLGQDDTKLINTADGKDVADLLLETQRRPEQYYLKYHAQSLHPDMMPCLVPGTILYLENDHKTIAYFWNTIRPKILVPYALVLSGTDSNSPGWMSQQYLEDPLLLKLMGTNPNITNNKHQKYESIPTGLSRSYPQEKYLQEYLELTNYQNPFANKDQWDLTRHPLDFDQDVFVHFGLRLDHRQELWDVLCTNTHSGEDRLSCHQDTSKLQVHDIYTSMSQNYRFGVSPRGRGWDCYRTYEFLMLGIIPIIDDRRAIGSEQLFEDLPVIHMTMVDPKTKQPRSKQDFVNAIETYVTSEEFRSNDFSKGWEKLFLRYTRRRLLDITGRDQEILRDADGKEYYQAYKYSLKEHHDPIYCTDKESCVVKGGKVNDSWLHNPHKWTQADQGFYDGIDKYWKGKKDKSNN